MLLSCGSCAKPRKAPWSLDRCVHTHIPALNEKNPQQQLNKTKENKETQGNALQNSTQNCISFSMKKVKCLHQKGKIYNLWFGSFHFLGPSFLLQNEKEMITDQNNLKKNFKQIQICETHKPLDKNNLRTRATKWAVPRTKQFGLWNSQTFTNFLELL